MLLTDNLAVLSNYVPELLFFAVLILVWLGLVLRARKGRSSRKPQVVLVDGSNVMYWRDNTPDITPVRDVVATLAGQGFTPKVVFDANAGYKLEGRYRNHYKLARRIGLPHEQVTVVPRGESADPIILRRARDCGGRVVSQDRFRDWAEEFPELARPDFRVSGGFDSNGLWLDLRPMARSPQARETVPAGACGAVAAA